MSQAGQRGSYQQLLGERWRRRRRAHGRAYGNNRHRCRPVSLLRSAPCRVSPQKIAAAQKARWAKVKAQEKKAALGLLNLHRCHEKNSLRLNDLHWRRPFCIVIVCPIDARADWEGTHRLTLDRCVELRDELLRWLFHGEQSLLSEGPAHPICHY